MPLEHQIALGSLVSAAASIFIAICSFGAAIYSAHLTRQHDRLSAEPNLYISFFYDKTGAGWRWGNNGLGPARLRGFQILIDGNRQPETHYLPEVFGKALKLPDALQEEFTNPTVGVFLGAGFDAKLYWLYSPSVTPNVPNNQYNRVAIRVCYCSIYNQCWIASNVAEEAIPKRRNDSCSAFADQPHGWWWNG